MADEFVTALAGDNARLRIELEKCASQRLAENGDADRRERRLMWLIFNMTKALGGSFTVDEALHDPNERLFIEWKDYGRGIRGTRITSASEYLPHGSLVVPEAA